MKLFILTKKHLLIGLGLCIVLCLVVIGVSKGLSVAVTAQKREIPIYSVATNEKKAALTFNVAWGDDDIDEIIAALKKHGVKATFFIVGDFADKYPDSVRKLYNAGHEIANHSDKHEYMTNMQADEIKSDINKCNEKLKKLTGKEPDLFRAPYGDYNNDVVRGAKSLSMFTIQWDVDSLDYKDLSVEDIKKRVIPKVQNGSIVLFHTDTLCTAKALPSIIKELKEKGYELVTVSELIYKENYIIDHSGKQSKAPEITTEAKTTAPETVTQAPETTKAKEKTTKAPETTKAKETTTKAPETTKAKDTTTQVPTTRVQESTTALPEKPTKKK